MTHTDIEYLHARMRFRRHHDILTECLYLSTDDARWRIEKYCAERGERGRRAERLANHLMDGLHLYRRSH